MTKFNFNGWNFLSWLKGNKSTIEEAVKVGLPYIASTFIVSPLWQQFVLTIVGKFILDALHYWVTE